MDYANIFFLGRQTKITEEEIELMAYVIFYFWTI